MSNVVTFEDLARMKKEILGETAPASIVSEHQANVRFRRMMNADASIGRLLQGPQFIDDVAIDSGAVKADKLEANLVLSTSIIAGVASPGDRIELDSSGQAGFGTVSGTPNTQYYGLDSTGWFVGVGADRIDFTTATGVLTVPAAVITSLTIADVGAGVVGGNYDTGSANPKLRLGTAGIEMWNAGGTKTVSLNSADGSFTLSNDPAGANRISVKDTGIELWKSSVQQFKLSTGTNAVEMILTGPGAGEYIGLNPTDGFWLGASTYAGASTKFRVSPLGVLNATSATISGAITATSGTLQTLDVTGTLTLGVGGLLRTSSTTSRVEADNTGLYGYNAGTARFRVLNDGSGFLGASTTLAWTTAGAVTLAGFTVTSSLLSSGAAGSYVTMSSGATAFSAGGATPASAPFNVTSAGALTATSATISGAITATSGTLQTLAVTGTLTLGVGGVLKTSATTSRVEMDNTGIYGYNAGTARFRVLNDGSGFLGASTTLAWTTAGAVTLGGFTVSSTTLSSGSGGSYVTMSSGATAFSAGGATPSSAPFNVTSAGAVTASNITITGASTFSGTITLPNSGSISTTTVDINGNSGGALGNIANLTIDGRLLLGTGGYIEDSDGSKWEPGGITLVSAGTYGDSIKWQQGGSNTGSVYATISAMVIRGDPSTGASVELFPSEAILRYNGTNESLQLQSTNRRALFAGYIYPGTGSAAQTTRHISDLNSRITLTGQAELASATVGGSAANWSTFTTTNIPDKSAGYVLVYINGVACRIPFYANG